MKLAFVVLAGCWTSPAPATTTPKPKPRAYDPLLVPGTDEVGPEAGTIAHDLSLQLRSDGPQLVLKMIRGPIVVLDTDTLAITTLCGKAAERAAQGWGQLLIDTSRAEPMCLAGSSHAFTCVQVSPPDVLVLELENPARWQIVSVTIGNSTSSAFRTKLDELRAAVASATCP